MQETLVPVKLPPGIFRNGTKLDASGRWYDGNMMRWVEGFPQPIGGWEDTDFVNTLGSSAGVKAVSAFAHRLTDGTVRLAVGLMDGGVVVVPGGDNLGLSPTGGLLATGRDFAIPSDTAGDYDISEADTWSFDLLGDTLVYVVTCDGRLITKAGALGSSLPSAAPTDNKAVVVTPERFVTLLAADGNSRRVQWADQESTTVWAPLSTNQAGSFDLATSGRIMAGRRSKGQTLIWTDVDLWSMNFIGGSLVYSFQQEGDQCGIVSRHAMVVTDSQVLWMGRNNFFRYDGFVQPIPCEVHDYVFEDFNYVQASQVWAMTIAEYSEAWWFYCSSESTTIDKYVVYNYRDNWWSVGELARTTGVDAGIMPYPIMVAYDRNLYHHEIGEDRDGATPFLESGPVTLDKDRVMRIQRIVPDVSALGDAEVSVYTSMYPTESETLNGPYSLANPTDVRLSAKHIRLRVEEAAATSWRVGTIQLGVIPQGRR
jgi:hypothetical protein